MKQSTPQPLPLRAPAIFAGLALLAPLPVAFFGAVVPLIRIYLLTTVSVAVASSEGAAGPVAMITGLFVAHSVAYTLLLILIATVIARGLRLLPARAALALVLVALSAGLALAVLTDPYVTPFGLSPRSNLLGALS